MEIRKLLFVTKFEELGFDALQALLTLRKAHLEHVVFMNVIERDKVAMQRGLGYKKSEEIKLRERANIRFIDWAENLFEQGMEVGVYIVVGNLIPQVIIAAEKEDADLIVIGRRHQSRIEMFYSGADITELLKRAERPVLVYKHMAESGTVLEKPFEKPLLAIDGSPASLRAVRFLENIENVINEVHLLYVANPKELKGDSNMSIQRLRKEKRTQLDEISEGLENKGIKTRSHVYIGETEEEIERAARENQDRKSVV